MEQPIICVLLASIAIIFNSKGMEANPCSWDEPHQDQLDFMVKLLASKKGHIQDLSCTGFAITNSWVLAPASCLSDPQVSEYKVNTTNGNEKDIKRIIIHEDYNNERGAGYDLALVELSSGLGTSSLTLTPKDKFKSVDKDLCVLVKQSKNRPGTLLVQSIESHQLTEEDCLGRFGKSIDQNLLQLTECYGSKANSVGVCHGETGAVVLCPLDTDKCTTEYFPVALASWGDLVCTPTHIEFLHIFTKLNYLPYHDWIESTIKPSE